MDTVTIIVDSLKVGKDMVLAFVEKSPSAPTNENDVAIMFIICATVILAIIAICIALCIMSNRKKEKTTREILIGLLAEKDGEYMKSLKDVVEKTIEEK